MNIYHDCFKGALALSGYCSIIRLPPAKQQSAFISDSNKRSFVPMSPVQQALPPEIKFRWRQLLQENS